MLTREQSYQEYFHYLAVQGTQFITYGKWTKQFSIEVEVEKSIWVIAKKIGYPGSSSVEDILDWLGEQIADLWEALDNAIQTVIDNLTASFIFESQWAINLITVMANMITGMNQNLAAIIQTVSEANSRLYYSIEATISYFTDMMISLLDNSMLYFTRIIDGVKEAILSASNLVQESFKTVVEWAVETLQGFYNKIKGGFSGIATAIVTGIRAIATIIEVTITGAVELAKHGISVLGNTIITTVEAVKVMVSEVITTAARVIEGSLKLVSDTILEVMERVQTFFESLIPGDAKTLAEGMTVIFKAQRMAAEAIKAEAIG